MNTQVRDAKAAGAAVFGPGAEIDKYIYIYIYIFVYTHIIYIYIYHLLLILVVIITVTFCIIHYE